MALTSGDRIALIPARGGSNRLPRKNIIDFKGRPIVSYSIQAAIDSGMFERVVVSTEDQEIAEIAKYWGAEVDDRDLKLATDSATVAEVCLDFLNREEQLDQHYEILCVLYATAPLRLSTDVEGVVKLVEPSVCDFALAVTEYHLPPHQALKIESDNWLEPMWPDLVAARFDSLPPLRVDNGSTYAVSIPAFKQLSSFYGPNMRGYEMPRERSIDIDTKEDYVLARYYMDHQI
jgi:CMP-N-acetylneuraminic acid synthetase